MDKWDSLAVLAAPKKHTLKIAAFEMWSRRDPLKPVNATYADIAQSLSVSVSTAKRYIIEIRRDGYHPAYKSKQGRAVYAWDIAAINFMKQFYLLCMRDVGHCSVRNAYNKTVERSGRYGWKVGSEQSAYVHLRDINDAVVLYTKGGSRALDNMFYIARDLSTLAPMQIVVGDQHRFDYWVQASDNSFFRPECYLWLDMRTRLVYGIAFDKNYNSRTVLRALRMGIEKYGKFECTYNDNGSSEKSAVADYVVDQLLMYGMSFKYLSDMFKTTDGKYIIEDASGNVLEAVGSQYEWTKKHRRIFANVKNAKTKPIERFFSTIEQILADLCLPGFVKELGMSAPEEEEAARRLEWQKKSGYILSPEEFIDQVLAAIDIYQARVHSSLKTSPTSELDKAIKKEGWKPTFINAEDVEYLFFEKKLVTVQGDRLQINNRKYIGPELTTQMIRENRGSLVGLNRRKVEVRYNPDDVDSGIFAIDPRDSRPIFLKAVDAINPFNYEDASLAIKNKKANMNAVRDAYRDITGGDLHILVDKRKTKQLDDAKKTAALIAPVSEIPAMSADEFKILVSQMFVQDLKIKARENKVYKTPRDRYEDILLRYIHDADVCSEDISFKSEYEKTFHENERAYYDNFIRFNK